MEHDLHFHSISSIIVVLDIHVVVIWLHIEFEMKTI